MSLAHSRFSKTVPKPTWLASFLTLIFHKVLQRCISGVFGSLVIVLFTAECDSERVLAKIWSRV